MKERLITLLCALGAIALFMAMFMRGGGSIDRRNDVPRPTTAERRGNGYYAALSWLEAEGIRTISVRDRLGTLASRDDLPPAGNLLLVTLPATTGFKTEEFLPLDRWVRAGNTLFVVAALSDNPDWAARLAGLAPSDLNLLTGLEFESVRNRQRRLAPKSARKAAGEPSIQEVDPRSLADFRAFVEPHRGYLVPNREHVYFDGVTEAVALSDFPQQAWTVKVPYEGFVLALARSRDSGEGVLWTRPLGQGRIIVSGFGSLFTNRALGQKDNARLLANVIAATVGPKGAVMFDDAHQGLGAAYDPERFYEDPRLYITIGVLVALWLAWVLGSTRLRMPVSRTPVPREADLVRATGSFLSRVVKTDAAARRLIEHLFARLQSPDAWQFLERHPRVSQADVEQLKTWYAAARANKRVPLRRLQNMIVRINGQIA